jgi:hypothetical protein
LYLELALEDGKPNRREVVILVRAPGNEFRLLRGSNGYPSQLAAC